MIQTRSRNAPLLLFSFGIIALAYLSLTLVHVLGVAHAGVDPVPPAAAGGWSLGEVMIILGMIGAVLVSLGVFLHGLAAVVKVVTARTPMKWDDGYGDAIENVAVKVDRIAAHFPDPPRTPGPVGVTEVSK